MLPFLKKRFREAKVHVVCQAHLYDFYAACPHVTEITGFDQQKLLDSPYYREELAALLGTQNYDLSLNSVYSTTSITDFLDSSNGAQIKIDYKTVVKDFSGVQLELKRHRNFIRSLGCQVTEDLNPLVWIPHHVEMFAEEFFRKNNLKTSTTIVLAAGVQFSPRLYDHYCEALESLCKEENLTVIVVGIERDRPVINNNLRNFTGKTVDLVGKTSVLEMAAIIKRSRMLVGADSAAAHIACAVKTPNAIVLGGGHYRRFFPYSSLTYCAVLHLECFGCDWVCKFNRPYCIQEVLPQTLGEAVRGAFESRDKRIYFQKSL
jgi:ADP-heptose:LPS heptosyltransferase